MTGIILGIFTVVLIIVCAFITLIVLMQRASSNAGLGASLGGGAAESALGGGASNVLVKGTIVGAILFFVLSFGLYLGHMATYESTLAQQDGALPTLENLPEVEKPTLPALPDTESAPEPTNGSGTSEVDVAPPTGNTMVGTGDGEAAAQGPDSGIDPSLLENPDQDGLPQSQDSFLSVPQLPTTPAEESSMFDQPASDTTDNSPGSE